MVMRLSTAGFHRNTINAILDHQSKLAKTQTQITTGQRFQSASEDPIAATRAAALDRTLADNAQYERNSNIVEARLSYEEQTLADVTNLLQQVRERALQGANTTLGSEERKMLANDIRQSLAAVMELANADDANGEFLFAGTSTGTRPFVQGTTGVNYQGDVTNRQVRISSTQSLVDSHTGADVFMGIRERNGVFTTNVVTTNTGDATIDVGRVADLSAWVPDNYTLQFTSPTDWQVVDDTLPTPNVITTGTGFTSGQTITFNGISVTLTGTPATNDSFTIAPAQGQDMFAMIEDLASTLTMAASLPSDAAIFKSRMGGAIANLDKMLERVVSVRAEVGSRLTAIDAATETREAEAIDLQSLLSDLRDTDYAAAITLLNQQYAGLQAAQSAYTKIAQLSLFDYL
jgi:flagellar hook-associated protein 3 FlgL